MARGVLASTVLTKLKAEIGDYAGTNTVRDAELYQLMSNKQQQLVMEYDWSFMTRRWDVSAPVNTQFITYPTVDDVGLTATINIDELDKVEVLYNLMYQPVIYGIGAPQYNVFNYQLRGQTSIPIRNWREASNPDDAVQPNTFEVWPVPSVAQTIRFTGERQPTAITGASIKVDLDDMLIALAVAADLLFYKNPQKAQYKMTQFQQHLRRLGGQSKTSDKIRILGGGNMESEDEFNKSRRLVAIAGNT